MAAWQNWDEIDILLKCKNFVQIVCIREQHCNYERFVLINPRRSRSANLSFTLLEEVSAEAF